MSNLMPHIGDKAVIQNGKPLRIKAQNKKDKIYIDDWMDVREDVNGNWYAVNDEFIFEVQKVTTH